jgi:hypothetical protein
MPKAPIVTAGYVFARDRDERGDGRTEDPGQKNPKSSV